MMDRRRLVLVSATVAVALFAVGAAFYDRQRQSPSDGPVVTETSGFVRPHAPVIGPAKAAVTVVEFFDPACESCRAFYPIVKRIMALHPADVRLVLRYAAFHKGSDEAVKIIEAARMQDKLVPVLEALLDKQPIWADHRRPDLAIAWEAARAAGLDIDRARKDAQRPELDAVLKQDAADIKTLNVKGTPTFFVNGKPLPSFGPQQLADLVKSEVEAARKK